MRNDIMKNFDGFPLFTTRYIIYTQGKSIDLTGSYT